MFFVVGNAQLQIVAYVNKQTINITTEDFANYHRILQGSVLHLFVFVLYIDNIVQLVKSWFHFSLFKLNQPTIQVIHYILV